MSRNLRVIVGGGSVAGCAIAALLSRIDGITVKVFERSNQLHERGAGIVLPEALLQQCIALGLFDASIAHIAATQRTFWTIDASKTLTSIWQPPIALQSVNWGHIYKNCRNSVPNGCYFSGVKINTVTQHDSRVMVNSTLGDEECDLFIAADGVNSPTRLQIYPSATAEYAGYIAWRGTIPVSALNLTASFEKNFHYFLLPDGRCGHLLIYPIPANDHQGTLMNWMIYETFSKEALKTLLIDKNGRFQPISIPRGALSEAHIKHLHGLVNKVFPSEVANIITKTQEPFLQVIFDLLAPQFVNERICFLGDAGMTLRPHMGSGVGHAITFSITLSDALKNIKSMDLKSVLQNWNQERIGYAQGQLALSKRIGNGLINTTHWRDIKNMDQWWKDIMDGKKLYWEKNNAQEAPLSMMFGVPIPTQVREERHTKTNAKL